MFKIFAKKGTTEKVVVPVPSGPAVGEVMRQLNEKFGGDWLFVDKVKPGEGIKFSDTQIYQGFSPDIERYTDAVIDFPINNNL